MVIKETFEKLDYKQMKYILLKMSILEEMPTDEEMEKVIKSNMQYIIENQGFLTFNNKFIYQQGNILHCINNGGCELEAFIKNGYIKSYIFKILKSPSA